MNGKKDKGKRFTSDEIKEAARGREIEILERVAGIPREYLDGKGHPCPKCGEGDDRFSLIDPDRGAVHCRHCFNEKNGDFLAAIQHYRGDDFVKALQRVADYLGLSCPIELPKQPERKEWIYTNKEGKPLYRVKRLDRFENGKRTKTVFQERFENNQWKRGLSDSLKDSGGVPFHWPELIEQKDELVFIVEGEKCCDVLTEWGLLATTASGGSNSKLDWSKFLQHRRVCILPDNDRPGFEYALRVANQLQKNGCEIFVVFLPELGEAGDVADWQEQGGSKDELLRIVEETPVWNGTPFSYKGEKSEAAKEKTETLDWEPFPVDALPSSIGDYVIEAAKLLDVDQAFIAPFSLAAVASLLGALFKLHINEEWSEKTILWVALVADSGSGKSPGQKVAIRPLVELQHEADNQYTEALDQYQTDCLIYSADLATWKSGRKKNPLSDPPKEPPSPFPETLIVNDTTTEALGEIAEQNPFGSLVSADELSGLIGALDAYRSGSGTKDLAFYLSLHNGDGIRIHRKTGKKIDNGQTDGDFDFGRNSTGITQKDQ